MKKLDLMVNFVIPITKAVDSVILKANCLRLTKLRLDMKGKECSGEVQVLHAPKIGAPIVIVESAKFSVSGEDFDTLLSREHAWNDDISALRLDRLLGGSYGMKKLLTKDGIVE